MGEDFGRDPCSLASCRPQGRNMDKNRETGAYHRQQNRTREYVFAGLRIAVRALGRLRYPIVAVDRLSVVRSQVGRISSPFLFPVVCSTLTPHVAGLTPDQVGGGSSRVGRYEIKCQGAGKAPPRTGPKKGWSVKVKPKSYQTCVVPKHWVQQVKVWLHQPEASYFRQCRLFGARSGRSFVLSVRLPIPGVRFVDGGGAASHNEGQRRTKGATTV